jgi:hypothetical protein
MSILPLLDPGTASEVRKLVVQRIAAGKRDGALISPKGHTEPERKPLVKYALVEIRNLNPLEALSDAETALLMGISLDTLERGKSSGKFS